MVIILTDPRTGSDATNCLTVITGLESVLQRIRDGGQSIATWHSHRLTVGRINLTIT